MSSLSITMRQIHFTLGVNGCVYTLMGFKEGNLSTLGLKSCGYTGYACHHTELSSLACKLLRECFQPLISVCKHPASFPFNFLAFLPIPLSSTMTSLLTPSVAVRCPQLFKYSVWHNSLPKMSTSSLIPATCEFVSFMEKGALQL